MRENDLIQVRRAGDKEEHSLKMKRNTAVEILLSFILKAGGVNPMYKVDTFRKDLTRKTWALCVDLFIHHAVSKSTFNKMKGKCKLSDFITVYMMKRLLGEVQKSSNGKRKR